MSDIAIRVADLSKLFRIGQRESYKTLRDTLTDIATTPFRRLASFVHRSSGDSQGQMMNGGLIWALKEVSFEVKQGEVIGIIGRNGAGKSTLLKVLSRISDPTEGYAKIRGRVGSLLEVGTGFHPELTGRENIYLNGAVLGMKKVEIAHKFDEIVAFAEIEKFLDTPVKRYSSGMYMRLAFAVAAHLEPEILMVDEVLSVGDAEFQKKCLGKLGDVTKAGRTILFVSHNLLAVENLCSRVIWLDEGKIIKEGAPRQVVSNYLQSSLSTLTERTWPDPNTISEDQKVHLHCVRIRSAQSTTSEPITIHTPLRLEFEYWNFDPTAYLSVSFGLYNEHNILLFDIASPFESDWRQKPSPLGRLRSVCHIPGDFLNDGLHRVALIVLRNHVPVIEEAEALVFNVHDGSIAERGGWYGKWPGAIRPMLGWETNLPLS
jgi:lipopolysaccharide transport system ATP-binding protein